MYMVGGYSQGEGPASKGGGGGGVPPLNETLMYNIIYFFYAYQ